MLFTTGYKVNSTLNIQIRFSNSQDKWSELIVSVCFPFLSTVDFEFFARLRLMLASEENARNNQFFRNHFNY